MKTEIERRVANSFDRIEMMLRGILAGPPLAKALETVEAEKGIALAAVRGDASRRLCGCAESVPMDENGRCLGCGKILARGG